MKMLSFLLIIFFSQFVFATNVSLIKQSEGLKTVVYYDSAGYATIGYGHKIKNGEDFSNGLTQNQADKLLIEDLKPVQDCITESVKVNLTENQKSALYSLVFNIGTGAFEKSTLLKKLNNGDLEGASKEFLKWCHVKGEVNKGLANRRKLEMELFLNEGEK